MQEDWLDAENQEEVDEFEEAVVERYLTFKIADDSFAVSILGVQEIIGMEKISKVPNMPDFVLGVINLRGQIVPVISLRRRFRIEDADENQRSCTLIVKQNEMALGLIVDEVNDVIQIPADTILEPKGSKVDNERKFILGFARVSGDLKIILDLDKLLRQNEWQLLREAG